MGGSGAIVDALVRGLEKNGGRLLLRSHVEKITVEDERQGRRANTSPVHFLSYTWPYTSPPLSAQLST